MAGRSTGELAARIGIKEEVQPIVRQLDRAGLIERGDDGWRLTAQAEMHYGWALRAMDSWLEELRDAAA